MVKIINYSIKLGISILILILLLVFSSFWYFSSGLPDYKKLSKYQPPVSSRVYADNGQLVSEYALEKRLFIPYEAIGRDIVPIPE